MEIYNVYLNDASLISSNREALADYIIKKSRCKDERIFESRLFIDGTGFMKTVGEEIHFVINGQMKAKLNRLEANAFIKLWNLEKYISYDISDLSGGWKKFLSLALFINMHCECMIFFDGCRQLSDKLIDKMMGNIKHLHEGSVYFIEWDAQILRNWETKPLLIEINNSTKMIKDGLLSEKNYE